MIRAYEWTHRHFPNLMDCRPIYRRRALEAVGFGIEDYSVQTMWVPVEIRCRPVNRDSVRRDHEYDSATLGGHISVIVDQPCGEQVRIAAEQFGLVFGDHSLHPVHVHRLEVGDVADDLFGGGPGIELFGSHPGHSGTEQMGAGTVATDEISVVHGCSLVGVIIPFRRWAVLPAHRSRKLPPPLHPLLVFPCQPLALFIDLTVWLVANHDPLLDPRRRQLVDLDVGLGVVVGVAATDAEDDRVAGDRWRESQTVRHSLRHADQMFSRHVEGLPRFAE